MAEQPVEDDQVLLSLELHGRGWEGIGAEDVEVNRCRFIDAQIPGVVLPRARLEDVEMTRCDLADVQVTDGQVFTTLLANSRLTGLACVGCGMRDVVFADCRVNLARFRMSTLRDVVFRGCDLTEASFQAATFNGVLFENCRLTGTQFSQAQVVNARFRDWICPAWVGSRACAVPPSRPPTRQASYGPWRPPSASGSKTRKRPVRR